MNKLPRVEFSSRSCLTYIMKRIFFFFVLLCLLWTLSTVTCFGQNRTSQENYQKLLQDYREYQGLIEPFNTKKSRHLTYGTVETQSEFLEESKNLISAEIKAITSYTAFVKSYLAEATQILNYRENYLYVKLDDELAFLETAKGRVESLSSLSGAGELMTDLATHYKKIVKIGYQVKAMLGVESVKKVFENVKVDKDKLNNFFSENKASSNELSAAKEKFSDLDKEINTIASLISQTEESQKKFESGDPPGLAKEIWGVLTQILVKINRVIDGYKNIVSSLK